MTFEQAGRSRPGLLRGDEVIDLSGAEGIPQTMLGLIEAGQDALAAAERTDAPRFALEHVHLLAPIARPPKFLAVGFNSPDHLAELSKPGHDERLAELITMVGLVRQAFPHARFPTWFNKQATCVTGPSDQILLPADSEQVDYEGEMAIVIAHRCRHVPRERALDVVLGCTVTNDVSVRDWQNDTPTVTAGKSYDSHGPLGPAIVTLDEVGDPQSLGVRTWINGQQVQDGSTAEQTATVADIVAAISHVTTLEAGDVIATGTPAGVGLVTGRYLRDGDVVRVEVDGLDAIENPVVAEATLTQERT